MRICKNEITDIIRDHFGANPLKIPDGRIRPMVLLEIKDKKLDYLGSLKYLVKGGLPEEPKVQNSKLATVSGIHTKKVDIKLGFKILENFLKAFGIDPAVVSMAIKNSNKLSFSFSDVYRLFIEPLELGQILSDHNVEGDPDNVFVKKIIQNKDLKLALITDTIMSSNFALSTYKENEIGAEIEIPLIQEYISDMNLQVKVEMNSNNEIKFKSQESLAFAFSCVEILIDPDTGKFGRGDWLKNIHSLKGSPLQSEQIPKNDLNKWSKLIIDKNIANPQLIEF